MGTLASADRALAAVSDGAEPKIRDGILCHAGTMGWMWNVSPFCVAGQAAGAVGGGLATTASTAIVGICEVSWARLRRQRLLFGVKERESAAPAITRFPEWPLLPA
jgi:hypothetical protein